MILKIGYAYGLLYDDAMLNKFRLQTRWRGIYLLPAAARLSFRQGQPVKLRLIDIYITCFMEYFLKLSASCPNYLFKYQFPDAQNTAL